MLILTHETRSAAQVTLVEPKAGAGRCKGGAAWAMNDFTSVALNVLMQSRHRAAVFTRKSNTNQ